MIIMIASCFFHEITLVNEQCSLDDRKYSFTQRTINQWNIINRLCIDCVNVNGEKRFKTKIDKYISYYTLMNTL